MLSSHRSLFVSNKRTKKSNVIRHVGMLRPLRLQDCYLYVYKNNLGFKKDYIAYVKIIQPDKCHFFNLFRCNFEHKYFT